MLVSELFYSLQGEGKYVGVPSVFLRLFGCNFTCKGFNNPNMEDIKPLDTTNIFSITDLDGNSFTKGCDSKYAWAKEYRHLAMKHTTVEVAKLIIDEIKTDILPHIVITGGEPLKQQDEVVDLIEILANQLSNKFEERLTVTIETNGSLIFKPANRLRLIHLELSGKLKMLFSFSPKLSCSGEELKRRLNAEAITDIIISGFDYQLKFVVKEESDLSEIKEYLSVYKNSLEDSLEATEAKLYHLDTKVMLMPLGATLEQYSANLINVAELCLKSGFTLTPRLHLNIWGNAVGK